MMGTSFCQYETPCGWCTRLNKECTERCGYKPKKKAVKVDAEKEVLRAAAQAAGFKSGIMNC